MKPMQFLRATPKSNAQRLGLLAVLLILVALVFVGFFAFANRLANSPSGFLPFSGLRDEGETTSEAQIPGVIAENIEPAVVPAGIVTPWDGTGRVTVLVMGLDYRDWSAGEGPSRTDTMMLLTLDPLQNTAGMLSIPRDPYADDDGTAWTELHVADGPGAARPFVAGEVNVSGIVGARPSGSTLLTGSLRQKAVRLRPPPSARGFSSWEGRSRATAPTGWVRCWRIGWARTCL